MIFHDHKIVHPRHYESFIYNNISSSHIFGEREAQAFFNSTLEILTGSSYRLIATNTTFGVFSHQARTVQLDNVRIERLEKLRVTQKLLIRNSHIEHFNASALLAMKDSDIQLHNVTIGRIEKESLILLGRCTLDYVMIEHAEENSVVLETIGPSEIERVHFKSGSPRPIYMLGLNDMNHMDIIINRHRYRSKNDQDFVLSYSLISLVNLKNKKSQAEWYFSKTALFLISSGSIIAIFLIIGLVKYMRKKLR